MNNNNNLISDMLFNQVTFIIFITIFIIVITVIIINIIITTDTITIITIIIINIIISTITAPSSSSTLSSTSSSLSSLSSPSSTSSHQCHFHRYHLESSIIKLSFLLMQSMPENFSLECSWPLSEKSTSEKYSYQCAMVSDSHRWFRVIPDFSHIVSTGS